MANIGDICRHRPVPSLFAVAVPLLSTLQQQPVTATVSKHCSMPYHQDQELTLYLLSSLSFFFIHDCQEFGSVGKTQTQKSHPNLKPCDIHTISGPGTPLSGLCFSASVCLLSGQDLGIKTSTISSSPASINQAIQSILVLNTEDRNLLAVFLTLFLLRDSSSEPPSVLPSGVFWE
ncbi:uncharacterized protein BJX67DRAFT_92368 [Aspergillus lucknowensis]|uniref:Uncharacterized protein n=1 Tax=Aspergillus lucknowensis TaxID=176173 RepID=A0ABR4M5Q6_9EURO